MLVGNDFQQWEATTFITDDDRQQTIKELYGRFENTSACIANALVLAPRAEEDPSIFSDGSMGLVGPAWDNAKMMEELNTFKRQIELM